MAEDLLAGSQLLPPAFKPGIFGQAISTLDPSPTFLFTVKIHEVNGEWILCDVGYGQQSAPKTNVWLRPASFPSVAWDI